MAKKAYRKLGRGIGAGRYRESIVIQQPTPAANAAGQDEPTWSTYVTRRADVEALRGRESDDDYIRRAVQPYHIRIRSDSETRLIKPQWQLTYDGATLQIEAAELHDDEIRIIATQEL